MNTKPKRKPISTFTPTAMPAELDRKRAIYGIPERGSAGYWIGIIVVGSVLGTFIGTFLTILLCGLPIFWLGPIFGLVCGFFISRKEHRRLQAMDEELYVESSIASQQARRVSQ